MFMYVRIVLPPGDIGGYLWRKWKKKMKKKTKHIKTWYFHEYLSLTNKQTNEMVDGMKRKTLSWMAA